MIDFCMKFNTEADAITAATGTILGQFVPTAQGSAQTIWNWNTNFVLPNMQAWRLSQDVTNPDGSITHTFLTGWYCVVSTKGINQQLLNDPNLAFALDRDGPPYVIKNNMGAVITNLGFQPIFVGSHYPIGGIS